MSQLRLLAEMALEYRLRTLWAGAIRPKELLAPASLPGRDSRPGGSSFRAGLPMAWRPSLAESRPRGVAARRRKWLIRLKRIYNF
jgi:hypothetical protein